MEPAAREPVLVVEGLRKMYGGQLALDGVDLTVRRGEVVGLLGPNGAGKSTLLRVVAGLDRADGGRATVAGHAAGPDAVEAKRHIGYVPEHPAYPPGMSAVALLGHFAAFAGVARAQRGPRVREALSLFGLEDRAGMAFGALSYGQQRRFALAQAWMHRPALFLLDEPTSGMDPGWHAWFRGFLGQLRDGGHAVLLSTHALHDAAVACDRVVLLRGGRVVADSPPAEFVGAAAMEEAFLRRVEGKA